MVPGCRGCGCPAGVASVAGSVWRGGRWNAGFGGDQVDCGICFHAVRFGRFLGVPAWPRTSSCSLAHQPPRCHGAGGGWLAALLDSFGKIAADLLFLSRPEVGELGEPLAAGRGGVSSAMPQKQNPVLSVLIRSAALQAPGLASQLHLAAATFNDERPDGAWHSEWPALRQLLALALGAAGHLRELAEGIRIFPPDAMRRNLEISGPLLLSEGVAAAVAPPLLGEDGKQKLQAVVDETLKHLPQSRAGFTPNSCAKPSPPRTSFLTPN